MNKINISNLNLNLIVSLEALLTEVSVSKAAERLDLTQSAMSHSLSQLRAIFNDKLLVRGQSGRMSLTPLAQSLLPKVNIAFQEISNVFSGHKSFEPESAKNTFYLGISDYAGIVLLPHITKIIRQEAPSIKLVFRHLNYLDDLDLFETGKLHLAIGNFPGDSQILYKQRLFADEPVCVAHKTHPAFKKAALSVNDYTKYPHVLVGLEHEPDKNYVYDFIKKQGYNIQVYAIVAHTLSALYALTPNSNLIASTVEKIALAAPNSTDLVIKPFPKALGMKSAITSQFWHPRYSSDPGHLWLRTLIKKAASCL